MSARAANARPRASSPSAGEVIRVWNGTGKPISVGGRTIDADCHLDDNTPAPSADVLLGIEPVLVDAFLDELAPVTLPARRALSLATEALDETLQHVAKAHGIAAFQTIRAVKARFVEDLRRRFVAAPVVVGGED